LIPPDGESDDARLELLVAEALSRLPFPETPIALEDRVRRLVRIRKLRRQSVAAAGGAALLVAVIASVTGDGARPVGRPGLQLATSRAAVALNDQEIETLLSLPPVDLLTVMDRRQDIFIRDVEQEASIQ